MTPALRRLASGGVLLLFWIVLWRRLTVGVAVSGVAVTALALWLVPGPHANGVLHWPAVLRLGAHVLGQLIVATTRVAWEVLTPTDRSRPGVVAVELPPAQGDGGQPAGASVTSSVSAAATVRELSLVALLITFTPGSFVVDVDAATRVVYVHLLHRSSEEAVHHEVTTLHRRVQSLWRVPGKKTAGVAVHATPEREPR